MIGFINKLTMISGKRKSQGANMLGYEEDNDSETRGQNSKAENISIITNPKALTFPLIVGFVKVGWEGLKILPISNFASNWIPFVLCVFLGMTIAVTNLSEEKPSKVGWFIGLALGLIQCLMIFAAVMGVTK